jgi:hypothetical protein
MNGTARATRNLTRCLIVLVLSTVLPSVAIAGDVGDIFWTVNLPPNMIDQKVYGARVQGAIFDTANQPTSDWVGNNILTGTLTGRRGDSLSFSGTSQPVRDVRTEKRRRDHQNRLSE